MTDTIPDYLCQRCMTGLSHMMKTAHGGLCCACAEQEATDAKHAVRRDLEGKAFYDPPSRMTAVFLSDALAALDGVREL